MAAPKKKPVSKKPAPKKLEPAVALKKKPVPATFYRTAAGNEPVREWLKEDLSQEERKIVGSDIKTVQFGWPIGMPTCRPMGSGLFEVRSTLENRIARVLFSFHRKEIVLLHGFIKKAEQTPQADIDLALKRKREVEE